MARDSRNHPVGGYTDPQVMDPLPTCVTNEIDRLIAHMAKHGITLAAIFIGFPITGNETHQRIGFLFNERFHDDPELMQYVLTDMETVARKTRERLQQ